MEGFSEKQLEQLKELFMEVAATMLSAPKLTPDSVTVAQAAALLKKSPKTIYDYIDKKALDAYQGSDGKIRIPLISLNNL